MSGLWEFNPVFEGRVLIEPRGKGRPRFFRGHAYTDAKTRAYEKELKASLQELYRGEPYSKDIPLRLEINFFLTRPKTSKRDRPTVKPDSDNLVKAFLDAANGVLFDDDCSVVSLLTEKNYSTTGFIEIRAWRLDELRRAQ